MGDRMTRFQWMSIIAIVIFGALFISQLVNPTSSIATGLLGVAFGVSIGVAFPGRRGIVRSTK